MPGHFKKLFFFTIIFFISALSYAGKSPLRGKKILIDPGHGGSASTDHYRVGLNGEREEWINLRVALLLKAMLEKQGAIVYLTRTTDSAVELAPRSAMAVEKKVDLFLSIHHNATADRNVNFPIIYFHGAASENIAGVELGKLLAASFQKYFYKKKTEVSLVSDYTIFPLKGASVLRGSYGIPGLLAEASFFSNENEELELKNNNHNQDEATAYLHAIESFFLKPAPAILAVKIPEQLPAFRVLEEADRMKPEALEWYHDFINAKKMMVSNDTVILRQAYELFSRSARSFPDSYIAREDHKNRALLLKKLHLEKESVEEETRAKEFYIDLKMPEIKTKSDLRKSILNAFSAYPNAGYAVAMQDLSSKKNIYINQNELFHAASTMKTAVLIETFKQSHEGKFALSDSILIKNEFTSIADKSIFSLDSLNDGEHDLYTKINTRLVIYDVLYRMITMSSNLSTNIIINLVGAKNVNETMIRLGAKNIKILRGVEDNKAYEKGLNNMVTAEDLLVILKSIATSKAVSPSASDSMIHILLDQHFTDKIARNLPAGVRVASKSGNITAVSHDSGIVFLPDGRKYVVVLLSKGIPDEEEASNVLANVSELIYSYVVHQR